MYTLLNSAAEFLSSYNMLNGLPLKVSLLVQDWWMGDGWMMDKWMMDGRIMEG